MTYDPFDELEPERYELAESPAYRFVDISRRGFLQAVGGGLLIALLLPQRSDAAPPRRRGGGRGPTQPDALAAWIKIGQDETITVFTGKVEVGQGARTSLAQVVAEELALEPKRINLVMGDTDLTPYDRGTHGSQTTPRMAPQLRRVAITTRHVLLELASTQFSLPPSQLRLVDGAVVGPKDGQRLTFGTLAKDNERTAVVEPEPAGRPTGPHRFVGKSTPKLRGLEMVTGKHRYTSDLVLPNMQHGKVLRAPSFGAKRIALNLERAKAMEGVTAIEDGEFVGIAATEPEVARQALAAIEAQWEPIAHTNSEALFQHLVSHAGEGGERRGRGTNEHGSVETALTAAKHVVEARYTVPYIAHAPLEPRAAVAEWRHNFQSLNVWIGTQHPFSVRDDLVEAFALDPRRVRVRVPDTGSGYGGKHTSEVALEAARLARAVDAPVKLVWTREEEFTWAYFRPAGVMDLRASLDSTGSLLSWEHTNYNAGSSGLEMPYRVENRRTRFITSDSPLRQGSYRGLAATANHFARECLMDDLAKKAGVDPLEFRRRHLDDPRILGVLEAAIKRFDWARPRPANHGFGMGAGTDKGGYVATVAEVTVDPKSHQLVILRLVTAFECGAIVNPDNLTNQVEGGVIMGLGGALYESIAFADGVIKNPRFSRYRVPRMADIPNLETILVNREDLPSAGAGECPICCVAPAIANAIYDATGTQLRSLPLTKDGIVHALGETTEDDPKR